MKRVYRARRMPAALTLVLALALGTCLTAFAAADPPSLDFQEKGSITLTLYSDEAEARVTDGALTLIEVAELILDDGDMAYRYTDAFAGCSASLEDVTAASLADILARYAESRDVAGTETLAVDASGEVMFRDLPPGLYLIIQNTPPEGYYPVDPFLVTVPMAGEDGWIYDVNATPKVEIYPEPAAPGTPGGKEPPAPAPTQAAPVPSVSAAPASAALPQTGQLSWPVPVLAVCGMILICVGFALTRAGRRGAASERPSGN